MSNSTDYTEFLAEGLLAPPVDGESLREIDEVFATWVNRNFNHDGNEENRRLVARIAKAVSYALHLKHTCLDLENYSLLGDPVLNALLQGVSAEVIRGLDKNSIGVEGSDIGAVPLVRSLDGRLIWLQKYFIFERGVANQISGMNAAVPVGDAELTDAQKADLNSLYDAKNEGQRKAVETALTNRFSVITGGPGTGKTYTVARIITLMLRHGVGGKENPRIALAAPTGKAANRMHPSLESAFGTAEIQALISGYKRPEKATTLHSLLGIHRFSPKPAFNADNPLPIDVLIVDEASMVALPMVYRILQALPESARLILLGDKDQLSSVEAGSVLGELCDTDKSYVATISRSYRYEDKPEIGELAQGINAHPSILPDFKSNQYVTKHKLIRGQNTWNPSWLKEAADQLSRLTSNLQDGENVTGILGRQTDFQILCALRKGPAGVLGINSMVETALGHNADGWYTGRPVMILSNDHQRKLYNGDVGLVLPVRKEADSWVIDQKNGVLRACFPVGTQEVKTISLAQMPVFETCYAMTVHKSQGSEYKKVMLVLPDDRDEVERNPVLTKELVYTGITRASEAIEIWSGEGVLEVAVNKRTVRMSGLRNHQS